uniref:Uncharacterized protein n=1 Tax=Tanacetum cinerariifolium TaxID=118510 RepID=A0A699GLB5_TANCI|nr:hypothetical protein [Tanacetum cinerariifolium]
MFDEYFNPPTIAVSLVPVANAPRAVDLADSSVSTSIEQHASSIIQKQTALGKDRSNPLTADSLLKTIWSSVHHLLINEVLTIPGQTTTGVNTPRSDDDRLKLMELTVFLLPKVEKVRIRVIVVDLQVFAVRHMLLLLVHKLLLFWTTVVIKQVNDVTRLQALVDKKKVVVTEAEIREILRLDDAEGVDCLPNEEIFAELARMGYEKPSTKLTRVGKGFLGVKTPLFKGMLVDQEVDAEGDADEHIEEATAGNAAQRDDTVQPPSPQPQPQPQPQQQVADFPMNLLQKALDACAALTRIVEYLEYDKAAQALEIQKLKRRVKKLEKRNKGRMIAEMDKDDVVVLMDDKEEDKKVEEAKDEPVKVHEVVEVVTTAKLIYEVTAASETVTAASVIIPTAKPQVPAALARVAATPSRRRKGVVIRNPKSESTTSTIIPAKTKSKDKGNPKEDPAVKRYQVLKRKPQTEGQARKNMIMYLKNVAGFKMDYFKGMSYDDIRLISEAKFNSNVAFLQKIKEQLEEEENRAATRA